MRTIINSLKYGDRRTKLFMWSIIISFFLALVFGGLCLVLNPLVFGALAMAFAIIGAVLVFKAGFTETDSVHIDSEEDGEEGADEDLYLGAKAGLEDRAAVSGRDAAGVEAGRKQSDRQEGREQDGGSRKADRREAPTQSADGRKADGREASEQDAGSVKADEQEDEALAAYEERLKKRRQQLGTKDEEEQEEASFREDYLKQYTEKSLNKLFKGKRLKTEPVAILIDSCVSERIRQCPAYVWEDKKHMCFMVLQDTPRTISFDSESMKTVTSRKGVSASPKTDYEALRYSEDIKERFGNLVPNCYDEGVGSRLTRKKNLYVLGKDMAVTALSLRALMKTFNFKIKIEDELLKDRSFSDYFRKAYECKYLWNDGVMTAKEYQDRIRQILFAMSKDRRMIDMDFEMELGRMIRYRLITTEYADYYRDRRREPDVKDSKTKKK